MCLAPPARCPFTVSFFGWEGNPTKIDYRKKGTLILASLLEDLQEYVLFCLALKGIPRFA